MIVSVTRRKRAMNKTDDKIIAGIFNVGPIPIFIIIQDPFAKLSIRFVEDIPYPEGIRNRASGLGYIPSTERNFTIQSSLRPNDPS